MPLDWRTETRICKLPLCGKPFLPVQYRQVFHTKACQKKSIAADFPEKKCGVKHCTTIFKPVSGKHKYCSPECLLYARRGANHAAATAYQLSKRKGIYNVTDEQFREKQRDANPLKCRQKVCAPDCRIMGMESLGCVA